MRNAIEGCLGVGKRRYGMNRIMMKLRETSETLISLIILVMNLEKIVRNIFTPIANCLLGMYRRIFLKEILAS